MTTSRDRLEAKISSAHLYELLSLANRYFFLFLAQQKGDYFVLRVNNIKSYSLMKKFFLIAAVAVVATVGLCSYVADNYGVQVNFKCDNGKDMVVCFYPPADNHGDFEVASTVTAEYFAENIDKIKDVKLATADGYGEQTPPYKYKSKTVGEGVTNLCALIANAKKN